MTIQSKYDIGDKILAIVCNYHFEPIGECPVCHGTGKIEFQGNVLNCPGLGSMRGCKNGTIAEFCVKHLCVEATVTQVHIDYNSECDYGTKVEYVVNSDETWLHKVFTVPQKHCFDLQDIDAANRETEKLNDDSNNTSNEITSSNYNQLTMSSDHKAPLFERLAK